MLTAAHPFGHFLDELMHEHDITQTELADRLDYSQGWIAHVRAGRKAPTLSMAPRIADVFPDVDEFSVYQLIKDARQRLGKRPYLASAA